jgi:hypothetical protein
VVVNLELFGIFQSSHYVFNSYTSILHFQLSFADLPSIMIACCRVAARRVLPLTLASNLSCVYASLLL